MRKTKTQKGITLVALIITIIVLLILAVVAIGAVKENGIISHAQKAATDYNKSKLDEESAIEGYESLIEANLPGKNDREIPVELAEYILGKDKEGRNVYEIINATDGAFQQDPTNLTSRIHEKIKIAYVIDSVEETQTLEYFIRYNRKIYNKRRYSRKTI